MNRKILVPVLVVMALVAGIPVAQAGVTINPQIGVNASQLDNDPVNGEHKARAGWQLGGYLRFDSAKFHLQPGLFYHLVGTELQTRNQLTHEEFIFKNEVHSIQFPVLIGYDVIHGGLIDLRLQAGTCVDFITGVDDNDHFTKGDLNSTYWSFKFAVGIDVSLLTFDLGYDLGMSNYFEDNMMDDAKMSGWFLNGGVRF